MFAELGFLGDFFYYYYFSPVCYLVGVFFFCCFLGGLGQLGGVVARHLGVAPAGRRGRERQSKPRDIKRQPGLGKAGRSQAGKGGKKGKGRQELFSAGLAPACPACCL